MQAIESLIDQQKVHMVTFGVFLMVFSEVDGDREACCSYIIYIVKYFIVSSVCFFLLHVDPWLTTVI